MQTPPTPSQPCAHSPAQPQLYQGFWAGKGFLGLPQPDVERCTPRNFHMLRCFHCFGPAVLVELPSRPLTFFSWNTLQVLVEKKKKKIKFETLSKVYSHLLQA